MREDVAAAGEVFLSGFDPAELEATLRGTGLQLLEDLDGHKAVARYDPKGLNCCVAILRPSRQKEA
ncbi:hypothetical protein EJP69_11525 [Variovorax gossypii]|uniref:Uncharacterized protein n=1 Tax=Variovorax gossypii TaxID=1679495 RepID=A0A3S0JWW4_9BURK|nr:hypothetical protein [Variovorax gossypii]RTQ35013.1 hypothetical protein EJP69_11525 [Variovorax gossypii]